ncbi:carbon monoxide dehydrogenase [Candidatus Woesearchaeota archaeon]|nr:MAG: carbon monoxide dehydrogenase [Candidatus Woesearchaeota archaeon]
MKIAITGKGGVGKTTIAAALALAFAQENKKVIAIDADPDSNLLSALGVPKETREKITPLSEMYDIIEERTGAKPGASYGALFCLTPKVDDLLDKYAIKLSNSSIYALVLGTIKTAGQGCFCPENALLKALIDYLLSERKEIVILDMEAGLEHLGRGTIKNIDALLIIVEPSTKSVDTARKIKELAKESGIKNIYVIINKIKDEEDRKFIEKEIKILELPMLAVLPYDDKIRLSDLADKGLPKDSPLFSKIQMIKEKIA